jgi:hypothetical protein
MTSPTECLIWNMISVFTLCSKGTRNHVGILVLQRNFVGKNVMCKWELFQWELLCAKQILNEWTDSTVTIPMGFIAQQKYNLKWVNRQYSNSTSGFHCSAEVQYWDLHKIRDIVYCICGKFSFTVLYFLLHVFIQIENNNRCSIRCIPSSLEACM